MALLFMDGFDHVEDGYDLLKWDYTQNVSNSTFSAGIGRDGGWGYASSDSDAICLQKTLPAASSEIIVGFALKITYQYAKKLLAIADGSTHQITCIFDVGSSRLNFYRNTTYIGSTTLGSFTVDTWYYVEIKVLFSVTVGELEVRINGEISLSLTGINTSASGNEQCTSLQLWGQSNNAWTYFDDLYICDTTGTENNDFLGDVTITPLYPTSDGNSSDFTPSTGVDNYATVDEPQLADVTDYNSSSTIGHKDTFGMTALTGGAPILAVQTVAAVNNTTTGTINVRTVSRSGDTPADNEGSDFALSQTVKAAMDIFEKEPTDDVAWTVAKVNASEFGIKIQS